MVSMTGINPPCFPTGQSISQTLLAYSGCRSKEFEDLLSPHSVHFWDYSSSFFEIFCLWPLKFWRFDSSGIFQGVASNWVFSLSSQIGIFFLTMHQSLYLITGWKGGPPLSLNTTRGQRSIWGYNTSQPVSLSLCKCVEHHKFWSLLWVFMKYKVTCKR